MSIHRSKCHLSLFLSSVESTHAKKRGSELSLQTLALSPCPLRKKHNHTHSHTDCVQFVSTAWCLHFLLLFCPGHFVSVSCEGGGQSKLKKWGRGGAGKSCNKVFIPFVHSHNFRVAVAAHREERHTSLRFRRM